MRVGIVHDYLAQSGGAERVVEALHPIWPDAPIYTSVYDPKATLPCFAEMDVRTSFLQRWAKGQSVHKFALPLYPLAFEMFDLSGYDLIVSSASSFAKGVITSPETCHVCYCHTPARFAWRFHEYMAQGGYNPLARRVLALVIHSLRTWDYQCANSRVDYFVANSYNVARRIRKYYNRESTVIHPPVRTDRFTIAPEPTADYFLVVSRLLSYKRVDLAVQACNLLNMPLKVVGGGPDEKRLRAMAGPKTEFLGRLPDADVVRLMANCKSFLFPGEEDFGIAPVEAMAAGRPVVALKAGGALETVTPGETGLFFSDTTPESLADALRQVDTMAIDSRRIRAHAEVFDTRHFQNKMRRFVEASCEKHTSRYNLIARGGEGDPRFSVGYREDDANLPPSPSSNGIRTNGTFDEKKRVIGVAGR
ncbi:MAG: glycosyltransferase [Akkermansiaceae bacterium]|nr:glycosyltransferase [Armatimonadota bacterium]